MNRLHIAAILCLITLGTNILRAEGFTHNFQSMFDAVPKTLTVTGSNKVGSTQQATYTCSGGTAKFYLYSSILSVCLEGSGAQVTTSAISDLDSLRIMYMPVEYLDFKVYTSTDSVSWTEQTVKHDINGIKTVKLPSQGECFVRFVRQGTNCYLRQIEYITRSSCRCLRVTLN